MINVFQQKLRAVWSVVLIQLETNIIIIIKNGLLIELIMKNNLNTSWCDFRKVGITCKHRSELS